jgi:hypothetical protein
MLRGAYPIKGDRSGLAQRPFEAYDQTTRKIFRFLAFSSPLLRSRRAPLQVSNRTVGDSMSPAFRSANQEAIGVKLNAMFLPTGCILPDGMGLIQTRFGENGMSVENATAATLDMGSECGVELHVPADRAFTCWHRSRPHRLPPRRWLSPLSRPGGDSMLLTWAWSTLRNTRDLTSREQRFIHARSSSMLRLAWSMKWFSVRSGRSNPFVV